MSYTFQQNEEATVRISNIHTLTGSGTTVHDPIWGITGTVRIRKLYGVVTTSLGLHQTAVSYRLNDQTAVLPITSAAGTTISAAVAGSSVAKLGLAAAAIIYNNNATGLLVEPTTLETLDFSEFVVVKKTAAATNIEFNYTTTDTPTSGAIQHFVEYEALSADGAIVAL